MPEKPFKLPTGLQYAKKAYLRSSFPRKPVGAALLYKGVIISGPNLLKTSPIAKKLGSRRSRIHAEMNILKNVPRNNGGTLFIYRQRKDGSLGLARPCKACMKLIIERGIKTIVYTTYSGFTMEKLL